VARATRRFVAARFRQFLMFLIDAMKSSSNVVARSLPECCLVSLLIVVLLILLLSVPTLDV